MSANVADLIFVRLAHIEDEEILFRIQPPLQLFYLNLRNPVAHRFFLPANAAKFVVVYQLRDRGMRAADRAIGILAQLEFAELHAQRVDQQQAADERLTHAENQLDHFGGLHHAHQTGQNAEHSAFGARWNQAGRWWLPIEAAVAGAVFGGEHTSLALEAKDRSVDVRLAREHATVIHQVAGGKIIGAVSDDIEIAKEFKCILAAQAHVVLLQIQEWIDRRQLVGRGIQFLPPYVGCRVNDLALQV